MRMLLLAAGLVSGCSATSVTELTALVGQHPEAGLQVLAHDADGTITDETVTDLDGHAAVEVGTDGFVSVVFRARPPSLSPDLPPGPEAPTSVFTTVGRGPGDPLVIHGPVRETEEVGVLEVVADAPPPAARYRIHGCTPIHVDTFPAMVSLEARCLGSDREVDVLVTALSETYEVLGYVAGRAELVGGVARFVATGWQTARSPVALTLQDVDPVVRIKAHRDGVVVNDHLFNSSAVGGEPPPWDGLAIDGVTVYGYLYDGGTLGMSVGQLVRDIPGIPSEITIAHDDFSRWAVERCTLASTPRLAAAWTIAPPGVDVVSCHAELGIGTWRIVVPPDRAGGVALPDIDGFQGFELRRPGPIATRYFDATEVEGFTAATATGIELPGDRILVPASGEVRIN